MSRMWQSISLPFSRRASFSWAKAMKGATPVPGPIMMTGVWGEGGRMKEEFLKSILILVFVMPHFSLLLRLVTNLEQMPCFTEPSASVSNKRLSVIVTVSASHWSDEEIVNKRGLRRGHKSTNYSRVGTISYSRSRSKSPFFCPAISLSNSFFPPAEASFSSLKRKRVSYQVREMSFACLLACLLLSCVLRVGSELSEIFESLFHDLSLEVTELGEDWPDWDWGREG